MSNVTTEKRPDEIECMVSKVLADSVHCWARLSDEHFVLTEFPRNWFTFPLYAESRDVGGTEFYWNSETNEIRQRTWDTDSIIREIDEMMANFEPFKWSEPE